MPKFRFTLKTWPMIALATIGLNFLTQEGARFLGINLPDQQNIEIIRQYVGWNLTFAFLVFQVVILMPAIEEVIFRWLLFRLPAKKWPAKKIGIVLFAAISSALFCAAHYIKQPWPDAAFLALFFFGIAQCWLYQKTKSLLCPILNHALFNLTNLILLIILPHPS